MPYSHPIKEGGIKMKHLKALAIKLPVIFIISWLFLGRVEGLTTGDIVLIALTFGIVEYLVGDLLLLKRTNNTVATFADFGLALVVIWFMVNSMTPVNDYFLAPLLTSIGIAVFEYFFHKYVERNILTSDNEIRRQPLRYQTESSRELTEMKKKEK